MIHRHGFPADTDQATARAAAVAEYRKLGGQADEPLVEFIEGDGELLVVVRSEPKPAPAQAPAVPQGLVIQPGDLPPELYDALDGFLNRNARRLT